jgi:hypothetical protein
VKLIHFSFAAWRHFGGEMSKRFGGAIFVAIWLISGQPVFAQEAKLIAEAKKRG